MMEPSIVVEMTLTDGQIKRFEVQVNSYGLFQLWLVCYRCLFPSFTSSGTVLLMS